MKRPSKPSFPHLISQVLSAAQAEYGDAFLQAQAASLAGLYKKGRHPANQRDAFYFLYGLYAGMKAQELQQRTAGAPKEAECPQPTEQP